MNLPRLIVLLLALLQSQTSFAEKTGEIAIVLDDMGYHLNDLQAFTLPKEITFSILPYTPYAQRIAEQAHQQGREILVHIPMQAKKDNDKLGKGALMINMQEKTFKAALKKSLYSLPYAQGINNHMGSALTEQIKPMRWIMDVLGKQGLYFLDSRTTANTVAQSSAKTSGIPTLRRHFFLDNTRTEEAMDMQLQQAIKLSQHNKTVVIIAHPYPETIRFLQKKFAKPTAKVKLIALNQLIPETQRLALLQKRSALQQANNRVTTRPLSHIQ
ncbi:divergent polysaccharide deacetylase family protein [Psychromonas antarctica]|uniref:divergent polysaccharide deacetylase family protein n=1 Tax=Psychromonas antarctica TaxID=67573 RepID=UPI001EE96795|nr:divergent polysaccharide deacetylase family protein [Psychromonas antarctica]MCG6202171.1 divergent polysaccharide deacetylase family protein [Psychromonas antarctica]